MIGRTLAHYRITAAIGAGGMGQVYRATDTKLGRDVALKILPAEMAANPEMTDRFRREARAVAALNHPNIVTIHSVEEAGGLHFLTMELVQGRSLDQLIPAGGLEVQRILEIANALSGALAAAHDKGIVHRDLKPANIMVTDDGGVKVLDFGLAKFQGPEPGGGNSELSTAMKTSAGVVMGTRPYMSPEQVQGRPLDHRTDIFSTGVVLFEMSTGHRPFQGQSGADLFASILRDTVPPVTDVRADLPTDLSRVIKRCLEKDPRHRIQTARDIGNELRDTARPPSTIPATDAPRPGSSVGSGPSGAEEGFRIAVLPFKYSGSNPDVKALSEGLSEEIVTGLSRFSYLRVLAHGLTQRYANESVDVRAAGREIGARYVMEGSLRQAGPMLRIAVQLVDAASGAHLWAETYNRPFVPEEIFALQDELVPRIVSTIADTHGILPRSMSESLRSRAPEQLSPYEAVLRSFGYFDRITAEELDAARAGLEVALRRAPANADAWAMLALLNVQEYAQAFNLRADSLPSGLVAARRAVETAPSSHLAHFSLAQALFFHKDLASFRNAAERAASLNPMDGNAIAFLGELLTYSGDPERGLALAARAKQLNPHHPGWYWYANFYDAYRRGDDRAALGFAIKVNMPGHWGMHFMKAAACGQLGDRETAGRALQELLKLRPEVAATVRYDIDKWWDKDYCDRLIEGLRKAGLALGAGSGGEETPSLSTETERTTVAIAVLPFSDLSSGKDQEYLCEGMAEEVMSALMGIEGMRVASRTSTFRARQDNPDLTAIARALSVSHVLEGSVRTAGGRLRVTAQLTDVATGFQLWSERFDRDAVDVFAVQDEIAAGVVQAVKARLAPGTAAPVPARSQVRNLEAYRQYLQGRHLRYSKNDHAAALRCFEAALALDPAHAPSMVGLAEVKVLVAIYGLAPTHASHAAAKAAIEHAAQIQGETSEGLFVLGLIAVCERDWPGAERTLARAIEIDPHNVRALCWAAILLSTQGRLDEAQVHLARAQAIDPLAPYPYAMSGWSLLTARKTREAMPVIEQALSFDPDNSLALWTFAMALVAEGRAAEAITWAERATTPSHRAGVINGVRGWVLAAAGRIEEAREVLASLRSRPASAPTLVSEGWILAALGDRDAAFAVFDRAADESQALVAFVGLPPFDTVRDDPRFGALLMKLGLQRNADKASQPAPSSGEARADEGLWVAVLPFKASGAADLTALADGLSEEVVTGLSRFSYLRVISRGATSRLASGATDLRAVAKEIGARYVMEGSLRQSGGRLRVAVQLTDAATGAHLWAETYDRSFNADDVFALQDDLVPRIVSTIADQNGILTRRLSEALRSRSEDLLTPQEAVLRAFSYFQRVTPEEHVVVRRTLERATREAKDYADAWAMLSLMYSVEFADDFNPGPAPLDRALTAARRAVQLAETQALGHYALAFVCFLRKEMASFRAAAERALALNPMDGSVMGILGVLIEHAGEPERGVQLAETAMQLNPNFPGLFRFPAFVKAYDQGKYAEALELAIRINMPNYFYANVARAAALGQLGQLDAAKEELRELLALRPDFAAVARREFSKWYEPKRVEHMIDGLAKAGLEVKAVPGARPEQAGPSPKATDPKVAIAVLPFSDMSPAKDQEYLCEGMAEEIMNALGGIKEIRVASRTSTFRAGRDYSDLPGIARALSVTHVLEGSVRTSGARLRVTAQLTDIATGYHLWSERFDREATDVFAVQDEISAGVVEAVRVRLSPGASSIHARPPARNLEAYRSYLKGRHLRGKEDNVGAMAAYEEAIRLDPSHAPSWTGLAESTVLAAHFNIIPAREACAAARKAVATAAELEGESANTRHVEAFIAYLERRWPEMETAWRRAIELQPTHVLALGSFGISLCARERFDEGLALLARAREADPLASFPCMLTGFGLLERGRAEEGQRYLADALSFEKEDAAALYISAAALVALGRFEEGIATLRHAVEMTGRAAHFVGVLGWALATAGKTAEARALLDELRARPKDAPALTAEAWLLGALGETDAAFEVMARAENENQANLYYTGFPGFDALRADPRFAAFRERLGLSPNRTF